MTDETTSKSQPLTLGLKPKLSLSKDTDGAAKPAIPAPRAGKVTVEVKRKRVIAPAPAPAAIPEALAEADQSSPPSVEVQASVARKPEAPQPTRDKNLTQGEWESRMRILQQAGKIEEEMATRRQKEDEERQKLLAENQGIITRGKEKRAKDTADKEALAIAEAEAAAPKPSATPTAEAAGDPKVDEVSSKASKPQFTSVKAPLATPPVMATGDARKGVKSRLLDDEDGASSKRDDKKPVVRADRIEPSRKTGKKLKLEDEEEEAIIVPLLQTGRAHVPQPSLVKKTPPKRKLSMHQKKDLKLISRDVLIPETITVGELANRMAVRGADVIKKLMHMGTMATLNEVLDADTAELIAQDFGHTTKRHAEVTVEALLETYNNDDTHDELRPPVVTIMGHVDHGKTSLLDALRKTDVVSGEAGGITQHIGAYQVTLATGQKITFIDTPGHAAFSEMRSRGANVTDIVVLVVAADDGIKEQTIEAINHAKASGVPIIVAINKMDKPGAKPDRVRQELLSHELVVESLGGDILEVEVSALKGKNLDKLEDAILLQAEILHLTANPRRAAIGVVVESRMERGRGPVATVLIQQGTLEPGAIFVCGPTFGRARALVDEHNKSLKKALPSTPVEVTGFDQTPQAGDIFAVVSSEAQAREIAQARLEKNKQLAQVQKPTGSLEELFARASRGDLKDLPVILKTDVHGSLEALKSSLEKQSTEEVTLKVVHGAVGGVNLSDVGLAKTSGAYIVAFNVRAEAQARDTAERDGVDIRYYNVIYDAIDDARSLMTGLLAPVKRENFLGYAQVRQVFMVSKVGAVAGCMITQGVVKRGCKVRLLRDNVVIYEGDLKSLKRFKDEVKEVRESYECGIALENYNDIKENDMIECFEVEHVKRELGAPLSSQEKA